jgi:hypothetical protein
MISGKKNICNFLGRSWDTVERWIREREFPARKIDGIWESDSELITAWRQNLIKLETENLTNSNSKRPRKLIRTENAIKSTK